MWKEDGFDHHKADPQAGEGAVELVVFRTGMVLAHAMVAHPVVADFASAPVPPGQLSEAAGTPFCGRLRGDVISHRRHFVGFARLGAVYHGKAAGSRQVRFQRLEGVNLYAPLVEAPMGDVGFFGVDKRGEPSRTSRCAA